MSWVERRPLLVALVLGAALRALAATGYGWFAVDDYVVVVEQAWRWTLDPAAPFVSEIRSPVLAWAAHAVFRAAAALGVREPVGLVHALYAALGLWSLAAIPPAYALTRRLYGPRAARWAALAFAAAGLMPRLSTRALAEAVAIVPLTFGLWLVAWGRDAPAVRGRLGLLAGVCVGGAVLLRFHLGISALALLAVLLCDVRPGARRLAAGVGWGLALAALAEARIDLALGRAPFSTVLAYLAYNAGHASRYGTSPWYTYLAQLLLWSAPPATLALAGPLWRAARRAPWLTLPLVAFVLAHSVVPHKEERFLFAILPGVLVLLGAALASLDRQSAWRRWLARFAVTAHLGVALAASLADSGRAIIDPLREVAHRPASAVLAAVGFANFPFFYLGRTTDVLLPPDVDALTAGVRGGARPTAILYRRPELYDATRLAELGLRCGAGRRFEGDLFDRLALALNPEHNKRRRPALLVDCEVSEK